MARPYHWAIRNVRGQQPFHRLYRRRLVRGTVYLHRCSRSISQARCAQLLQLRTTLPIPLPFPTAKQPSSDPKLTILKGYDSTNGTITGSPDLLKRCQELKACAAFFWFLLITYCAAWAVNVSTIES